MGSWDRMVVPYPFTRAVFIYGEPMTIARDEDIETARAKIEKALNALTELAEKFWQ